MSKNIVKLGEVHKKLPKPSKKSKRPENITIIQSKKTAGSNFIEKEKWTHVSIMCLLEILWEEFDSAKLAPLPQNIIYEKATKEMRKNGFNFSTSDIKKKYMMLIDKFHLLKSQPIVCLENKFTWEYFELVLEVLKKERSYILELKKLKSIPKMDDNSKLQSHLKELYSSAKLNKTRSSNISAPPGVVIRDSSDFSAFMNQWEAKQFSNEDYKLKLLDVLFNNIKEKRALAEEDVELHLKMRNEKNKHLKQIIAEMNNFRTSLKNDLTSFSEIVLELIAVIKNICDNKNS